MLVVWDPNGAGDQAKGKQNLPRAGNELTFPSSSGIWQSVWLEPVSAVSIERLVATPDLDRTPSRCMWSCAANRRNSTTAPGPQAACRLP